MMQANHSSRESDRGPLTAVEQTIEKLTATPPPAAGLVSSPDNGEQDLSRPPSEAPYSVFSRGTKVFIIFMVSISALISPLAATVYYPALNPLADELHVSNSAITLSITTYMILQALAPAVVATLSDTAGRRISFIICFGVFLVANIGLALQTNYAALLVLRAVQSSGSSATIALSMAVAADIATSAERGRYMGYALSGLLLGTSFGPLLGGTLAQYLGWRSIFWFLAIFSAVFLILFAVLFPETCRKVVGNGAIPAKGISLSLVGYIQQRNKHTQNPLPQSTAETSETSETSETCEACETPSSQPTRRAPNPLAVLRILIDKESSLILIYNALVFSGQMLIAASLPTMLAQSYALNTFKIGLCFLPLGLGALTASITQGYVVDWNFRRHAARAGLSVRRGRQQDLRDFPLELARCEVALPNHIAVMLGMVVFGWLMEYRMSLAGPEAVLFVLGFSIMGAYNVSNAFIVDLHRESPATATAAVNLTRCLVSAGGVAVIVPMINAWGRGWSFTFFGLVDLALLPVLWVLVRFGPRWRMASLEKEKDKEAERRGRSRQFRNVRQSIGSKEKDTDA